MLKHQNTYFANPGRAVSMVGRWGDNSPILLLSQPSLLGSRRGESSRYKTLEGKQVKTKLLDGEGD